jgi:Fur family zinc uptake transcriptional regulator
MRNIRITSTPAGKIAAQWLFQCEEMTSSLCRAKFLPARSKRKGIMAAREMLTKNQVRVLEKLEAATGPLSAYTLLDQLRSEGFRAPLQVYRALEGLMNAGFVHRLESMSAFVACSELHDHSHRMIAFAICDKCGQVAEFSDEKVGKSLDAWVGSTGFAAKKAVIEFRGTCAACAVAAA